MEKQTPGILIGATLEQSLSTMSKESLIQIILNIDKVIASSPQGGLIKVAEIKTVMIDNIKEYIFI